ncbi:MAG: TRAP transporter fused permease subunit [Burkholderiaceae bacterium]
MTEIAAATPRSRALRVIVTCIAVVMSLWHMYITAFGPPEAYFFRGGHLLFTLVLVVLLYPSRKGGPVFSKLIDAALLIGSFAFIGHLFINHEYVINRIIYIDDLSTLDLTMAVVSIAVVLEATRRVIGWALPLTALVFLVHAMFASSVGLPVLLEQLYMSTEGIFGSTLAVSASYVMLFVVFGAFMEKSGTGQLFMDFAMSVTGHQAGGPGKVAVVSSTLFGTVSGSAVANVMVDGPITIPLMKRSGFRPHFAAAIESVASTGGQIMPPVMGAAAFVMAEFLAVSYLQVTLWALIPAVLYYVGVFAAVHFQAKRYGLLGVPRNELPRFGQVMVDRGHLFLPILIILAGLMMGYSAPLCALVAALSCLPLALMRKTTREGIRWSNVIEALEEGAKNTLAVAMACACAGIVIGCVAITGIGITFTQFVVGLSQNLLPVALALSAVAAIIVGMGMPTTPAYIVMVALLVPALIKLGAPVPAAHMFAFYFAILSAVTPPVALAVFAAAGLAKSGLWQTCFAAMAVAAPAYIVPFMFVYEPALLLEGGDLMTSATAFVSATAGVVALAAGLQGWAFGPASMWQRGVLLVAAILLIKPGLYSDLTGVLLIAVVLLGGRLLGARVRST